MEAPNYLDLYSAGVDTVEAAGIELTDSAKQYFMNHARNAVRRIETGDVPEGLTDPSEPFRELAREVVKEQPASHYGRSGLLKASVDAINAALRRICPLFPFCD